MTAPVSVPGLRQPVEIIVDRWGIPHIYAENTDDLYVAQGFNAARDRLFQIDMWRRRGLGEMSAVFGPAYVEADRAARLFLYRGSLAEEWAAYGFDAERVASCFTAGINAYIDWLSEHPDALPPEFTRLGYLPAKWAPADVVRIRSHGPQLNVIAEFTRAKLAAVAGVDADRLRQPLKPEHAPFVPEDVDLDLPDDLLRTYYLGAIVANAPTGSLGASAANAGADQDGSNNWALAAHRTTTGRPILASDPHRAYSTPSLRYIAHLSAPGLDVIGAGEPALPGVTLGHNGTAAFGFTIFPIDCQDIYVYDLDPADAGRYRFGDGYEAFVVERESLAVEGKSSREVELTFTRHGPVVHVDAKAGKAYAIRTMWTEPGTSAYFGSIDYQGATSWEAFRAALENWGSPGENLLYADTAGTIAWKAAGRTPRRVGYDGLLPVPGDGRYDWDGYYSASDLPEVVNPPEGFWATANEYNLPPGFPEDVRLAYEWADPSRHTRIVEELSQDKLFSLEDSQRLQVDVLSVSARTVVSSLRGLSAGDDAGLAAALRLLTTWDFVETADSAAAALYHLWTGRHLAPALAQALLPARAAKLLSSVEPEAMREVLAAPEAWLGAGGRETLADLLRSTLSEAYIEAAELLGPDPAAWAWGSLHTNLQPHLLGGLEPDWNVGPVPIGGSGQTVNATHSFPEDYSQTIGASFRMVVDVGEWDNSVCVNTPGQSGDPRSPHYRDLHAYWHGGEYVPMLYTRAAVEAAAGQRIRLEPAVPVSASAPASGDG